MSHPEDSQADPSDASAGREPAPADWDAAESHDVESATNQWLQGESEPTSDLAEETTEAEIQTNRQAASEDSDFATPTLDLDPSELPSGMLRLDSRGSVLVDATSGRSSVLGYGDPALREACVAAMETSCGDSAVWSDGNDRSENWETSAEASQSEAIAHPLRQRLQQMFQGDAGLGDAGLGDAGVSTELVMLRPSADSALDSAIGLARRLRADKCFRTIALVGSDHGRTGMCRSASGSPGLHEGFGPMMAGFSHVPVGDLDALRAAIDDQTACVLLAPVDLGRGAAPCESDYLMGVRQLCDEHDLLLLVDETQLVFGASGELLTFRALSEIRADLVVLSAGLFNGLPGGLVLGSSPAGTLPLTDIARFPVHAAILERTLAAMHQHRLPAKTDDQAAPLAVAIAQAISGFEFVRDLHATGMTIGIETDLDAEQVVRSAYRNGLKIASAGATSVCLQPPLQISEFDQQQLLDRLGRTMESLEREFAEPSL